MVAEPHLGVYVATRAETQGARSHNMKWMIKGIAKFSAALIGMTILSAIAWGYVGERLYCCTDATGFGFLSPGNWVHNFSGHPIVAVPNIDPDRSMDGADTIKQGWSIRKLWALWICFATVTVVLSALLASIPWGRRTQ